MKLAPTCLFALALAATNACGGDPRAYEYVTDEPDAAALVGRYDWITWQSVVPAATEATRDRTKDSSIVLRADGTFSAVNVPRLDLDRRAPSDPMQASLHEAPALVAVSGRWKVDAVAGTSSWTGADQRVWGVRFESEPPILEAWSMTGRRLAFVLCDPDCGEGLIFGRSD
jgi:hypothetical protein